MTTAERPRKLRSLQKYLMLIPSSRVRGQIRRRTATNWHARRPEAQWPGYGSANPATREILADSIFDVENARESRGDGQPDDRLVVAMRAARNRLYDDLGWNE